MLIFGQNLTNFGRTLKKLHNRTVAKVSRNRKQIFQLKLLPKTEPSIFFSILISGQERKTNLLVGFLEEVLAEKFAFEIYWPLELTFQNYRFCRISTAFLISKSWTSLFMDSTVLSISIWWSAHIKHEFCTQITPTVYSSATGIRGALWKLNFCPPTPLFFNLPPPLPRCNLQVILLLLPSPCYAYFAVHFVK